MPIQQERIPRYTASWQDLLAAIDEKANSVNTYAKNAQQGSYNTLDSVADLKLAEGTSGAVVNVLGFYESGDGGGGLYKWGANAPGRYSEVGANDIYVVRSDAGGFWARQIQNNTLDIRATGAREVVAVGGGSEAGVDVIGTTVTDPQGRGLFQPWMDKAYIASLDATTGSHIKRQVTYVDPNTLTIGSPLPSDVTNAEIRVGTVTPVDPVMRALKRHIWAMRPVGLCTLELVFPGGEWWFEDFNKEMFQHALDNVVLRGNGARLVSDNRFSVGGFGGFRYRSLDPEATKLDAFGNGIYTAKPGDTEIHFAGDSAMTGAEKASLYKTGDPVLLHADQDMLYGYPPDLKVFEFNEVAGPGSAPDKIRLKHPVRYYYEYNLRTEKYALNPLVKGSSGIRMDALAGYEDRGYEGTKLGPAMCLNLVREGVDGGSMDSIWPRRAEAYDLEFRQFYDSDEVYQDVYANGGEFIYVRNVRCKFLQFAVARKVVVESCNLDEIQPDKLVEEIEIKGDTRIEKNTHGTGTMRWTMKGGNYHGHLPPCRYVEFEGLKVKNVKYNSGSRRYTERLVLKNTQGKLPHGLMQDEHAYGDFHLHVARVLEPYQKYLFIYDTPFAYRNVVDWVAGSYTFQETVYHQGAFYQVRTGQTAEEPGTGTTDSEADWEQLVFNLHSTVKYKGQIYISDADANTTTPGATDALWTPVVGPTGSTDNFESSVYAGMRCYRVEEGDTPSSLPVSVDGPMRVKRVEHECRDEYYRGVILTLESDLALQAGDKVCFSRIGRVQVEGYEYTGLHNEWRRAKSNGIRYMARVGQDESTLTYYAELGPFNPTEYLDPNTGLIAEWPNVDGSTSQSQFARFWTRGFLKRAVITVHRPAPGMAVSSSYLHDYGDWGDLDLSTPGVRIIENGTVTGPAEAADTLKPWADSRYIFGPAWRFPKYENVTPDECPIISVEITLYREKRRS